MSKNPERVVKCPVDGCDAEKLARGMHLHVLRSVGDGHGVQGEIPDSISFDDLEDVGTQEVEVNYPAEREVESVARLCPYCSVPFKGKHGVLIHLGQVAGRKNHPPNASQVHEPEDFPIVKLDDNENIVSVVDSRTAGSPDGDSNGREADESEEAISTFLKHDERGAYSTFSKDEIDYLYELIHSETDDNKAKRLLQRACATEERAG